MSHVDNVTYAQLEAQLQQINNDMKILNGKTKPGTMPNATAEQLAQLIVTVDGELQDMESGNISDPFLQAFMNNPNNAATVQQLDDDFNASVGGTSGGPSLLQSAEEYVNGGSSIDDFKNTISIANGPSGDFGQIWNDEQALAGDL